MNKLLDNYTFNDTFDLLLNYFKSMEVNRSGPLHIREKCLNMGLIIMTQLLRKLKLQAGFALRPGGPSSRCGGTDEQREKLVSIRPISIQHEFPEKSTKCMGKDIYPSGGIKKRACKCKYCQYGGHRRQERTPRTGKTSRPHGGTQHLLVRGISRKYIHHLLHHMKRLIDNR